MATSVILSITQGHSSKRWAERKILEVSSKTQGTRFHFEVQHFIQGQRRRQTNKLSYRKEHDYLLK